MSGDLLGVVEACYRLEGDEAGWLRGIAESALPHLDRGGGLLALAYRITPDGAVVPSSRVALDCPPGIEAGEKCGRP